jgi:hypothetical protein
MNAKFDAERAELLQVLKETSTLDYDGEDEGERREKERELIKV